jgi:hypothetical protein
MTAMVLVVSTMLTSMMRLRAVLLAGGLGRGGRKATELARAGIPIWRVAVHSSTKLRP